MLRLFAALGLVASLLASSAAEDTPAVKEYVSKEGRYKALFPGKVELTESVAKKGDNPVYSATTQPKPDSVYTVVHVDLPGEIPADQVKKTLPLFTAGIKGKLLSEKELTLGTDKLPARETVYELPKAHIRHFIVLDGKRLYQVIVGGPTKEDVTSKEADKFISSFQIVK